jgi:hypothetical protein
MPKDKIVSIRISPKEFSVLQKLARAEVRTPGGWLKSRIVMEGIKAGIISASGTAEPEPVNCHEGSQSLSGNEPQQVE